MCEIPKPSKEAAARVKDRLPIPETCPHCNAAVKVANNEEIYGKPYGDWPWAYLCTGCKAYVGMHPNTHFPLGTLATPAIRNARKRAKELFNPLWQSGKMRRGAAYTWLARELGIAPSACHFGWFDVALCERAIAAIRGYR